MRPLYLSEKVIIILLIAGELLFAPILVDFFPFSTFPMFSDSPEKIFLLERGEGLNESDFEKVLSVLSPYYANRAPKLGRSKLEISAEDLEDKCSLTEIIKSTGKLNGVLKRTEVGPINRTRVGVTKTTNFELKEDKDCLS